MATSSALDLHDQETIQSANTSVSAGNATRAFFLVAGIGMASWAPMVPFAKTRLALDEAHLGGLLLCMGLGSTAAMPLAGFLSHRYGSRRVMTISGLLVCVALPLLTVASSPASLAAGLVFFGGSLGVLDVAMNSHAVEVERLARRPLMSGFHALFSVGGLAGSAGMALLLQAGASLLACAAIVSALLVIVVFTQRHRLLVHRATPAAAERHRLLALPSSTALLLGVLCLVVFLAEGAMLDWSAVFLRSVRGFGIAEAGLGYSAFSVAMAAGRLLGDRTIAALGPVSVVRLGSVLAAAGFLLATALPWGATSLAGFVLVGLGAANIVPVLFSAAGRIPGTAPGIAIATVTALGYSGMLAGPALIGFVARASSLPLALSAIAGMLILVAASARVARR